MRVLALDVGSSSTRACAYDERGRELGEPARRAYEARHGHDGSAELDADELVAACEAVLAEAGGGQDATGISCFWHSLLLLDGDNRPLTPVLLWQDRRSAVQAEELRARLDPAALHARTGCFLHPSFWPAKLAWLREQGTLDQARRVVSFADYLFLKLTGELRTTLSSASGSGLLDLPARAWDGELLDALGLDESLLPPISDEPAGTTFPALGDGACSNLGAGVHDGRASGADDRHLRCLPRPARRRAEHRVRGSSATSRTRAGSSRAAAVSDGGNLYAWLERTLRLETVEPREPDGHGLTFLPLLGGERSPGWNPRATGAIAGLGFDADAADLLQAGLEGVVYRLAAIADTLPEVREVVATGHALLASEWWIQLCADVLDRPVVASAVPEGSARGAAVHALERLGAEPAPAPLGETYTPDPERTEIYAAARERQRELYRRLF